MFPGIRPSPQHMTQLQARGVLTAAAESRCHQPPMLFLLPVVAAATRFVPAASGTLTV
jgi:hypothetical protein